MQLSLVIPTSWGRKKKKIVKKGDQFYDYPTALDEAGANHPSQEMAVEIAASELLQFHAVKHAFDEHELLNPGKAVPTLNRCADFGAMHVHEGKIPFPEIERF